MSIACFSGFPSWQSPHGYLQNVFDWQNSNCFFFAFRVWVETPGGFTYMANTVEQKENEVAGHQSRDRWGKEARHCAEANEDRRVWKNVSVDKMHCLHVCCPLSPTVLGSHPEKQRMVVAGRDLWMWPCPSPLLGQVTCSRLPVAGPSSVGFRIPAGISAKQLLAFAFMPLLDSPKSFRREISAERICKTRWTTENPGCLS